MATITSAGLISIYPEWEEVYSQTPAVVDHVVELANAKPLPLYTESIEESDRRYLEAGALLYVHPFGRDMLKDRVAPNWYREEATRRDLLKGTQYRAPGWEHWRAP